jgi:hypothetical protein
MAWTSSGARFCVISAGLLQENEELRVLGILGACFLRCANIRERHIPGIEAVADDGENVE